MDPEEKPLVSGVWINCRESFFFFSLEMHFDKTSVGFSTIHAAVVYLKADHRKPSNDFPKNRV